MDELSGPQPSLSTKYTVGGMTCEHCARAVTDELAALPGVLDVAVDVDAGFVTVTADREVEYEDVRVAVSDAGYELVG